MRKLLTSSLTALLLTGVAVAPLATGFTLLTADAAYAKSDKAKDKSKGKSGNKGKSSNAGNKGGSRKSAKAGSKGGNPLSGLVNRLSGKDKAASQKVAKKTVGTTGMHPSELGNMNGALNANINAVLAHIRNGNTNGPVGIVAALAVANANASGQQEIIDAEQLFLMAEEAAGFLLTPEAITEYLVSRNGTGGDPEIDAAIEAVDTLLAQDPPPAEDDPALQEAVMLRDSLLGDQTVDDYILERDGDGGDGDVDAALASVGVDVTGTDPTTDPRPSEEEVAEAEALIEAQGDAENDALALWNKNPDSDPETISPEEQALLDGLNDRFSDEDLVAIDAAIAETQDAALDEADEEDGEDLEEEELVLLAE